MFQFKMKLFVPAILVFLVVSCQSIPDIPGDLTVPELVQRAQEASDKNKYIVAEHYYQEVINRYPLEEDAVYGAKYEIAFIHYKQKKYVTAREEFNEILQRYEEEDAELLPEKYKKLSLIVLDSITEKEQPFSKKKKPALPNLAASE